MYFSATLIYQYTVFVYKLSLWFLDFFSGKLAGQASGMVSVRWSTMKFCADICSVTMKMTMVMPW